MCGLFALFLFQGVVFRQALDCVEVKIVHVQLYLTFGILFDVLSNFLVVHAVLVPIKQTQFHLVGNHFREFVPLFAFRVFCQFMERLFQKVAVLTLPDFM